VCRACALGKNANANFPSRESRYCWVCVIFFARVVVSKHMRRTVRGGAARPPLGGYRGEEPPHGGSRVQRSRNKNLCIRTAFFGTVLYLGGFSTHGFFADGFLFSVKELGFWTNTGHWVRVLDVASSYMYFVL
jgi:hypothetical protein